MDYTGYENGADSFPPSEPFWTASILLGNLNYSNQLEIIRQLLDRNKRESEELVLEMSSLDAEARRSSSVHADRLIDLYGEAFYRHCFLDPAHSLIATGLFASFTEAVFSQAFRGIETLGGGSYVNNGNGRWAKISKPERLWDCHYINNSGPSLILGIQSLAEAVGLDRYLPKEYRISIDFLFRYRNRILHHGMEWPVKERERFIGSLTPNESSWIEHSCSDGDVWMVSLTQDFAEHYYGFIQEVLKGIGQFTIAECSAGRLQIA